MSSWCSLSKCLKSASEALFAAVCLYCSDLEDLRGRQVPLRTALLNCVCKQKQKWRVRLEGQNASI